MRGWWRIVQCKVVWCRGIPGCPGKLIFERVGHLLCGVSPQVYTDKEVPSVARKSKVAVATLIEVLVLGYFKS